MRESISSGHFSHDQQVKDAVGRLTSDERAQFDVEFPEWDTLTWPSDSSWLDCEASGVDVEYTSWVCDWIENNTGIYWEDGEPWIGRDKIVALVDSQGTACPETALYGDDDTPENRARVEANIDVNYPEADRAIPGTWVDCTDNEAL